MPHKEIPKKELFLHLERLYANLEQQKSALDRSAIVAITDIKGKITYVNGKFCEISKYTEEELLGQNHRLINSGYHDQEFFGNLWKTIAHGNVWRGEIRNRAKDGSFYWVHTTIVPYLDEDKKPYQYVSIRFDITHQKRMELELKHRNKQLADFVHIVSHNLRAPLSNLLLLTSMIKNCESMEEQRLYVDQLARPVQHLNETFSELVASLQVTQDLDIKREELYFNECLQTVVTTLNIPVVYPDVDLISNFEQAPHILYPKKYLISILHNLLSNAIKYRSPDRPLIVEIATMVKKGSVCLTVKDNGRGMDMEVIGKKLFGLQKTFHGNHDARGFGLFMTKSQVESMGGSISAQSEPDKGSTFIVKFSKSQ